MSTHLLWAMQDIADWVSKATWSALKSTVRTQDVFQGCLWLYHMGICG